MRTALNLHRPAAASVSGRLLRQPACGSSARWPCVRGTHAARVRASESDVTEPSSSSSSSKSAAALGLAEIVSKRKERKDLELELKLAGGAGGGARNEGSGAGAARGVGFQAWRTAACEVNRKGASQVAHVT